MKDDFTTSEMEELLNISRNTLFAYEAEPWMPPVKRMGLKDSRAYTVEHIRAVARKQYEQYHNRSFKRGDLYTWQWSCFYLFLSGDFSGLMQLEEQDGPLPNEIKERLLKFALYHFAPYEADVVDAIIRTVAIRDSRAADDPIPA